ncbi:MAG: YchJ family protein [Pseudomonadota bacterium]
MRAAALANSCPCGSGVAYAECCAHFHRGAAAPSAEALMRSRYSAYVLCLEDYLLATWHASTRPARLDLEQERRTQWLGLRVVATRSGMADDGSGSVEFVARYKVNGKAGRLHEISRFLREQGRWFYLDGEIESAE